MEDENKFINIKIRKRTWYKLNEIRNETEGKRTFNNAIERLLAYRKNIGDGKLLW